VVTKTSVAVPAEVEALGDVFVTIAGHDSGCTSYGVVASDGTRRFVKVAFGSDRWQLERAIVFHDKVSAPHVLPMEDSLVLQDSAGRGTGLGVVYPFLDSTILNDPTLPGTQQHDEPGSALQRFIDEPTERILGVVDAIVDAHVAIAEQGFVAVDFYDGCVMYDFDSGDVQLVDLDLYTEGPYSLTADRQFGSTRFMAPEEFCRGAVIDQQTTVFTLGRAAMVLLGPDAHRRLGLELSDAVDRATQPRAADRWPDVAAFARAWRGGRT
jgi:hypothetical protein